MSDTNDDFDEIFENPFEDSAETESTESAETDGQVKDTETEETNASEDKGEAEAEDQSATEEEQEAASEGEEPVQGTETEEKATDGGKPAENASNQEWAAWRKQQKAQQEEQARKEQAELEDNQQKYLDEAETETELRLRRMEVAAQKREYAIYTDTVNSNNQSILNDYERVVSDPDTQLFNPNNKDSFNKRQYERMQRAYEAENILVDNRGNIVEVRQPFYTYAKEWAKDFIEDSKVAEARGRATAGKNLSKSEPSSNSGGKPPAKSDPILDLWASED